MDMLPADRMQGQRRRAANGKIAWGSGPGQPLLLQAGMGELLSQVQKIGSQVQDLVRNINKVVGNEDFRKNIEESVSNINGATHEAKDLLAGLRKDLVKVDEAVANVVKITAAAEGTMGKINYFVEKTIGDPAKVESINNTITNISEVTGVLSKNRDYIATTIQNISEATGGVARVTASLDPGRGLFRLLTDEQAGQELLATIQNLQRAANALATCSAMSRCCCAERTSRMASRRVRPATSSSTIRSASSV